MAWLDAVPTKGVSIASKGKVTGGKKDIELFIENHWTDELNFSFHLDDIILYFEFVNVLFP